MRIRVGGFPLLSLFPDRKVDNARRPEIDDVAVANTDE
jgi:hypothetical protein